ncbi:MAG: MBL fold metallo-hydrolase [Anaerolineales bacterium]|nr:MBL fold metallo-hydrolase [Anaerolineales bacterium]
MPKLIFLGTSNAVPDENHENTHMAIVEQGRFVLIDCVNSPTVRIKQAGLDFHQLTDLILTHFHPDHVSGVPSLLMSSWLLGRSTPLRIYGLQYTLERVEKMMDFYEWRNWPGFFPVSFHPTPAQELATVLESGGMHIRASPVHHMVPAIGLRVEFTPSGKTLAYSCDTEPCSEVVRLAQDADVLIHEATGASLGHTSAAQAGEIAARAGARSLYLIHYRTGDYDPRPLVEEARSTFGGPVFLAQDFMQLEF